MNSGNSISNTMKTTSKESKDAAIAAVASQNNDKLANIVFQVMTGIVLIGSCYLYYYLQEYLDKMVAKFPNHVYPEYKDYLIAILFIPIFVVC